MGLGLWRKKRTSSPAECLPPHCCLCSGSTRTLSGVSLSHPVGSIWRWILCDVFPSPIHSSHLVSLESLSHLDRGHPLLTTVFDYPIYLTQPSLPFGLSAPVMSSMSSEANSQDRRGKHSLTPSDLELGRMLNESPVWFRPPSTSQSRRHAKLA